ncbi:TetR/AcrR family transcriptional regulator [Aciditerrimonas ferrireducens]|jgi:AcrR family transcriptional regulator|uniref:TetR/AcrR family transcriptional regulator n=1 Tax=Aciditerrimonas ferrireducens TaxID=667306 RepID=A0ABV6C4Y6_9ACTN
MAQADATAPQGEPLDPPGQRAKKGAPGRVPNRQATEAALEDAALTLLRRDGVLAGVNLREVADAAGVNRGLVYHYYGSRGKLLRAALARHGQRNLKRLRALADLPGPQRWRRFLRTILRDPEAIELTTLLLMDGTARIRATPLRDETMAAIRRDVEAGELPEDLDLVAFHTVMVTAAYGYLLYRTAFAAEHDVPLAELDRRVADLLYGRLLEGLKHTGPAKAPPRRRAHHRGDDQREEPHDP